MNYQTNNNSAIILHLTGGLIKAVRKSVLPGQMPEVRDATLSPACRWSRSKFMELQIVLLPFATQGSSPPPP